MPHLSDDQLLNRLESLTTRERETTISVLHHLDEVERRSLHLTLGYGSLFDFTTRYLGYSEGAASRRIRVARTMRKHPEIARLLRTNEVNLSTVATASRMLDDENAQDALDSIRNKTQREVQKLVARQIPSARVLDQMRPVCSADREPRTTYDSSRDHGRRAPDSWSGPTPAGDTLTLEGGERDLFAEPVDREDRNPSIEESSPTSSETELSEDVGGEVRSGTRSEAVDERVKVQFAAGPDFVRKFEEARTILSGRFPRGASFEQTLEAALDVFLEHKSPLRRRERRKKNRQKRGSATRKSRQSKRSGHGDSAKSSRSRERRNSVAAHPAGKEYAGDRPRSRHVPAAVRDEVFARDGGRCTYVGPTGRRCDSKHGLQIDHVEPFARGGKHEAANLRLICANHNRLEAERTFGVDFMTRAREHSRSKVSDSR